MTPSLETSWVEFERPDVLKAVCLPGLLRRELLGGCILYFLYFVFFFCVCAVDGWEEQSLL